MKNNENVWLLFFNYFIDLISVFVTLPELNLSANLSIKSLANLSSLGGILSISESRHASWRISSLCSSLSFYSFTVSHVDSQVTVLSIDRLEYPWKSIDCVWIADDDNVEGTVWSLRIDYFRFVSSSLITSW